MKRVSDRFGFTLMEVNLAIFIMAVAVLGMVALYPLGFRESQHARSDAVEAVVADGILNPLVATLSSCSSNMTWSAWTGILGNNGGACLPADGWLDYCADKTRLTPASRSSINSKTANVLQRLSVSGDFNSVGDALAVFNQCKNKDMCCALVVSYGDVPTFGGASGSGGYRLTDFSRIVICLRISKRAAQIFEQPAFYAEVHFQGDPNQ